MELICRTVLYRNKSQGKNILTAIGKTRPVRDRLTYRGDQNAKPKMGRQDDGEFEDLTKSGKETAESVDLVVVGRAEI